MKIYAVIDKEACRAVPIAFLYCYEKAEAFIMELSEDLDEWEAPLLFQKYVREGRFTIPRDMTRLWVRERIVPSDRQNIGSILKNAKLREYSETALLGLSKGRCAQDHCFLEEISLEDVPDGIKKRAENDVMECFSVGKSGVVCLFRDNTVRRVALEKLYGCIPEIRHVLKNENLLYSVKVGIGGKSISFDDAVEISVEVLRDPAYAEPVTAEDMSGFAQKNIVDTTRACELLQCSRQNIAYLVDAGKLTPVMNGTKEKFFTRGDIERALTE